VINENGKQEVQMMKLKFQKVQWKTWRRSSKAPNGNRYLFIENRFACQRGPSRRLTADITSHSDHGAPNVSRAESRTGVTSPFLKKTRRGLVQKFM